MDSLDVEDCSFYDAPQFDRGFSNTTPSRKACPMRPHFFIVAVTAAAMVLALSACGQKGPLRQAINSPTTSSMASSLPS